MATSSNDVAAKAIQVGGDLIGGILAIFIPAAASSQIKNGILGGVQLGVDQATGKNGQTISRLKRITPITHANYDANGKPIPKIVSAQYPTSTIHDDGTGLLTKTYHKVTPIPHASYDWKTGQVHKPDELPSKSDKDIAKIEDRDINSKSDSDNAANFSESVDTDKEAVSDYDDKSDIQPASYDADFEEKLNDNDYEDQPDDDSSGESEPD